MSYLGPLRLHFAGKFQAAVSTVNNDPSHFDNDAFLPSDQELQTPAAANGWWNPRGDADWRLIGCEVTAAFLADGTPAPAGDPVLGSTVADSDRLPPAKLVDLDPFQQMVSTIWGLEMRLADPSGDSLFRGAYEPAPFFDIWDRSPAGGGDIIAGAMYQSVLTGVEWGEIDSSPFLLALREASPDGTLSVKFNVDGYNMTFGDPDFTLGRIVGTIGPGSATEPRHMVLGRQLGASPAREPHFFKPAGRINFCAAAVDAEGARIYLDLGNALPTVVPGGEIELLGPLELRVGGKPLCAIPYDNRGWYARSAGVVALPPDRPLSEGELRAVEASPLALWRQGGSEAALVETPSYVRADSFVFRCDSGGTANVRLLASHLGKPAPNVQVLLEREVDQFEPGAGTPPEAIDFPASVTTGPDGVAVAAVTTQDPGNPRHYIDGQVYGIRPTLAVEPADPANQWNFVSILLWDRFEAADPPTWFGDLQPIFQQYANLYPVMQDFLDLSSYEDVCANRKLLQLAFELDPADPNSMPVTRDLSTAKREAILTWLRNCGPDGKPLLGEPPPGGAPPPSGGHAPVEIPASLREQGGKAAAAARRKIVVEGKR